jgi:hypothetical protein
MILLVAALYGSIYDHSPPPERYRGDIQVTVRFESESKVESDCETDGAGRPPPGQHWGGCKLRNGIVVLPNPCLAPLESDWRLTACHEIGHANGWPKDHPGN